MSAVSASAVRGARRGRGRNRHRRTVRPAPAARPVSGSGSGQSGHGSGQSAQSGPGGGAGAARVVRRASVAGALRAREVGRKTVRRLFSHVPRRLSFPLSALLLPGDRACVLLMFSACGRFVFSYRKTALVGQYMMQRWRFFPGQPLELAGAEARLFETYSSEVQNDFGADEAEELLITCMEAHDGALVVFHAVVEGHSTESTREHHLTFVPADGGAARHVWVQALASPQSATKLRCDALCRVGERRALVLNLGHAIEALVLDDGWGDDMEQEHEQGAVGAVGEDGDEEKGELGRFFSVKRPCGGVTSVCFDVDAFVLTNATSVRDYSAVLVDVSFDATTTVFINLVGKSPSFVLVLDFARRRVERALKTARAATALVGEMRSAVPPRATTARLANNGSVFAGQSLPALVNPVLPCAIVMK